MKTKILLFILLQTILTSCDPGFEEKIMITNRTNTTLPVKIIQSIRSHNLFDLKVGNSQINLTVKSNDSIFETEFNLLPNEIFYLWEESSIGKVSMKTRNDGEDKFKEICDSLLIKGVELKQNVYDFNNWDYYFDSDYHGGGKVEYNFKITEDKLNYNR